MWPPLTTVFHIAALQKKKHLYFLENSSFFRILNKNLSKWTYLHPASKRLKGMPDRSRGETLLYSKVLSVRLVCFDIARPLLCRSGTAKRDDLIQEGNSTQKNPNDAAEPLLLST